MNYYEHSYYTKPSDYKREHELLLKLDVKVAEDGIGPYEYWGCKGYDHGKVVIDEVIASEAYLVRQFVVKKDSPAPTGSDFSRGRTLDNGNVVYSHYHEISVDSLVVELAVKDFLARADVNDVLEQCDDSDDGGYAYDCYKDGYR